MSSPPDVVGVQEIARMLGLSRARVESLVDSKGFPEPTQLGRGRVWSRTDVVEWARSVGRTVTG